MSVEHPVSIPPPVVSGPSDGNEQLHADRLDTVRCRRSDPHHGEGLAPSYLQIGAQSAGLIQQTFSSVGQKAIHLPLGAALATMTL